MCVSHYSRHCICHRIRVNKNKTSCPPGAYILLGKNKHVDTQNALRIKWEKGMGKLSSKE